MQRTPRLRLGSIPGVSGAGSLIRDVRRELRTPTAFRPEAQGCREAATLGSWRDVIVNPNAGCASADVAFRVVGAEPRLGFARMASVSQGRRSDVAPTLGSEAERLWRSRPRQSPNQPAAGNAGGARVFSSDILGPACLSRSGRRFECSMKLAYAFRIDRRSRIPRVEQRLPGFVSGAACGRVGTSNCRRVVRVGLLTPPAIIHAALRVGAAPTSRWSQPP
jgi:hypothetical protein